MAQGIRWFVQRDVDIGRERELKKDPRTITEGRCRSEEDLKKTWHYAYLRTLIAQLRCLSEIWGLKMAFLSGKPVRNTIFQPCLKPPT